MSDSFLSLPLQIDEKTKAVQCLHHALPVCPKCDLNFTALNTLHKNFNSLTTDSPPPVQQKPHPARSAQINKMRESGNNAFKLNKYADALRYYSLALEMALSRPPWEQAALCRDETVILLCNRSAAHFAMENYPESLADAEAIVELKKPWPKGHHRKGKALQAMGRLDEAQKAVELGLMFDPNDNECNILLREIKKALEKI